MQMVSFVLHHFFTRGNGTQIRVDHIQDAETIQIQRTMLDENTKYQLSVEAYNHFGASHSDPFILCVRDIGKHLLLFKIN